MSHDNALAEQYSDGFYAPAIRHLVGSEPLTEEQREAIVALLRSVDDTVGAGMAVPTTVAACHTRAITLLARGGDQQ